MTARRTQLPVLFLILTRLGCDRPDPAGVAAPRFRVAGVGRPSVLVNPNANDQGTAKTIQEGIDMVGEGGTVLVLPGTYAEAIVIGKGLTLESVGGEADRWWSSHPVLRPRPLRSPRRRRWSSADSPCTPPASTASAAPASSTSPSNASASRR